MPGLRLESSDSKLSIPHTFLPPPAPTIPTTTSSTVIIVVHCHYNQELLLWATGKVEGTACSLAPPWLLGGQPWDGRPLGGACFLVHMCSFPKVLTSIPCGGKQEKRGMSCRQGKGQESQEEHWRRGEGFRAWLLQSTEATY